MCFISFIASLLSCLIAIVWAWRTHSVWALVVQNVAAYALRTLGFWLTTRFRPALTFVVDDLRRLFAFSRNLLISGLMGSFFNNIYTLLIGRCYGTSEAGYFVQADRIRMVASASFTQVVQSVSYPILSRINNRSKFDTSAQTRPSPSEQIQESLFQAYRRIILVTLLLVGFIMTLLMCVSEDLLQLLMGGPDWRVAGRFLMALGVAGILFPLHAVNQNILLVKGLGRTVLWLEIVRRTLMVVLIIAALQFGVDVFVWSYALYSFMLIFLNLHVCGRPIGYGLGEQLRDIRPILLGFLLMLVVAQCSNHVLALCNLPLRFLITLALSLSIGLLYFHRHPSFHEAMDLMKKMIRSFSNER